MMTRKNSKQPLRNNGLSMKRWRKTHQLMKSAATDELSLIEFKDAIEFLHRTQPMGNPRSST